MMKIRIWKQITDLGDGSSSTQIFASREEAYEGYDDEGFDLTYPEVPIEVDSEILDITGFEVVS